MLGDVSGTTGVVSVGTVSDVEPEMSVIAVSETDVSTVELLLLPQDFTISTMMMIRQIRETAASTNGR